MFTPASKNRRHFAASKDKAPLSRGRSNSPSTPAADNRGPSASPGDVAIPNRPSTGTPAPWASRLSVVARVSSPQRSEKGVDDGQIQPVYVGEVPQIVRKAQADSLSRKAARDVGFSGGIDKCTSLAWMICENQFFIWRYLSTSISKDCVTLDFPTSVLQAPDDTADYVHDNRWLVCVIDWIAGRPNKGRGMDNCTSAGVIICHQKTQALVYWSDVFSESGRVPVIWHPAGEKCNERITHEHNSLKSVIASAIPGPSHEALALGCNSGSDLLCFYCTSTEVCLKRISLSVSDVYKNDISDGKKVCANSLVWRFQYNSSEVLSRQFFLLTDHEIQCWNAVLGPDSNVTRVWSHEVVGADVNYGIKKDLAGQKHVWLLDMQVDESGKEFTVLVATLCKDRVSSSSFTQYSLLTMQYVPGMNVSLENCRTERVLEKKTSPQVIIPKARVEDENSLFSLRLRIGGKPAGSTIILSGDGTATVTNYWRGATRLYIFDLPQGAGKVLDASVLPSAEKCEEGGWVVLTEKAGIWAIPEKAVLLGGVEPPERSLSRNGSIKEGVIEEEKRTLAFDSHSSIRRSSLERLNAADGQKSFLPRNAQRTAHDEASEILLGRFFQDFLSSGEVNDAFEKLRACGAFDKEGETNVFSRMSKSIVDTLAKHWTTTRGTEFVASAVVISQLLDKQQKHECFLQFLALSKCHEELSCRQRQSLQLIVEHGEKLSGLMQLRELQNVLSQNQPNDEDSPSFAFNGASGALWDLIQLVGDRARRNTVLLMDRDNVEVFYSKVSDLEELFNCLSQFATVIIGENQHFLSQIHRAYELSNACTTLIEAVKSYRNEHRAWYPRPEGLVPWNCQAIVRAGLWSIASAIMDLLEGASEDRIEIWSGLSSQLGQLTDVILDAYTSTIMARSEVGEDNKGLVEEYHKRRDVLLDSLYRQGLHFATAQYQETCKGVEDDKLKKSILRETLLPVLSIAKRHEGYQTLWNVCLELHDTELLRSIMRESMGPTGGFSHFVFKEMYGRKQFAKLLRLGEEFQDELNTYLKKHKEILWLHEVFLNNHSLASDTLHTLAVSHDKDISSSMFGEDEENHAKVEPSSWTLAERKRLLNLSKIAAIAGNNIVQSNIQCIEAEKQLLSIQEEIVRQTAVSIKEQAAKKILPPAELIEICLEVKTRTLVLLTFDIFAWAGSSFRSSNRRLLEECWMSATNQDNWAGLYQRSQVEGWSDEVCMEFLQKTVLFQASHRCYGPGAKTHEGMFDEVLPLQKDDAGLSKCSELSVEEILMQHKDFPEAGKLMVTAIVMAKMGVETEEGIPMEFE